MSLSQTFAQAFSYGILANGLGDLLLASGLMLPVLESGPFKDFTSINKSLLITTFSSSFFIHGIVRFVGARDFSDRKMRLLTVLSFLGESLQALQQIQLGTMSGPLSLLFLAGPWLPIVYLTFLYPEDDGKKQKKL